VRFGNGDFVNAVKAKQGTKLSELSELLALLEFVTVLEL